MANRYAHPNKNIILEGLKRGRSIHDMMLLNTDWHQPSRLAVKMVCLQQLYHKVYFSYETAQEWLNYPSIQSVKDSLKVVEQEFELFAYDPKKQLFVPIKPKETDKQLKARAQRTISNRPSLGWIVADLVEHYEPDGKSYPRHVATHTNQQFIDQVGCGEKTVTRYLNQMVEVDGYVLRYEGNGRRKSYYVRPDYDDDEDRRPQMEENYEPHKPTHTMRRQNESADAQPFDQVTLAALHRQRDKPNIDK